MNLLRRIFRSNHGWRAGWRFALFLAIYMAVGRALDPILTRIHFPDRVFIWWSMLLNYLLDIAFLVAIVHLMSRIERERFSSYGLPLVLNAGTLLWKGVLWGFVPSALILVPRRRHTSPEVLRVLRGELFLHRSRRPARHSAFEL